MDTLLVKLYYEQYAWPIKKIASFIGQPESYIRAIIEEEKLSQNNTPPQLVDERADGIQVIKDAEVTKQQLLQPLYAHAEALILARVIEALESDTIDIRADAHEVLKAHANVLQMLKAHAVSNRVIDDNNSSGVQINVIGSIQ